MDEQKTMPKPNKKNLKQRFKENLPLLIMTLPGLAWLIIFYYIPVFGNIVAFKDYRIQPGKGFFQNIFESEWVGWRNFKFLFSSSNAWVITRNTVLYNLAFIVLGLVFAVGFAIILSQLRNKTLVKGIQTSMLLPYFLSWVVVSFFVDAFIAPGKGWIPSVVADAGGDVGNLYTQPNVWPGLLLFLGVWKGVGYSAVIYFAAIVGIDRTYYEAAEIDGANKWQQIRHVMIPHLVPLMTVLTIIGLGNIFRADFGLFYQIPRQSGPLFDVTAVLDTYIFNGLKNTGDITMSTAAGLYQSVVGFVLLLTANFIIRRVDEESALF